MKLAPALFVTGIERGFVIERKVHNHKRSDQWLSAHAMLGDGEHCLMAGMDDYISKPINREELFTVIDGVLHRGAPPAA